MNRVDFMSQLERLLQSIAPAEREEALQYYNDYFDDAGKENEQEVIEALGNPARVAENIKRDLLGSGYGDALSQSAQASDRALVEYGQSSGNGGREQRDEEADRQKSLDGDREYGSPDGHSGNREYGSQNGPGGNREYGSQNGHSGNREYGSQNGPGGNREYGSPNGRDGNRACGGNQSQSCETESNKPAQRERDRMPAWAIALLATALLLGAPVIAGALLTAAAVLFGVLVVWYALIFGFGVAAVCLFLVLAVLVITGILCLFVNSWVGMAMIGGGLICGAVGILFLMLTVAMAGIVTPTICKGVAALFRKSKKGLRKCMGRLA